MRASHASSQPTLIFDGVCNLCKGAVSFLVARDRDRNLRYTSNDTASAHELLGSAGVESTTTNLHSSTDSGLPADGEPFPKTVFLYDDGQLYQRSDAVIRAFRYLPWPWRLLSFARVVPRPLRDGAYRLVAANRYRVFGRSDSCRLPTPEDRELFI